MTNIKMKALQDFTIKDYDKLTFVESKNKKDGYVFAGDIFICQKDLALHLLGEDDNLVVAKVIEVIPIDDDKSKKRKGK